MLPTVLPAALLRSVRSDDDDDVADDARGSLLPIVFESADKAEPGIEPAAPNGHPRPIVAHVPQVLAAGCHAHAS